MPGALFGMDKKEGIAFSKFSLEYTSESKDKVVDFNDIWRSFCIKTANEAHFDRIAKAKANGRKCYTGYDYQNSMCVSCKSGVACKYDSENSGYHKCRTCNRTRRLDKSICNFHFKYQKKFLNNRYRKDRLMHICTRCKMKLESDYKLKTCYSCREVMKRQRKERYYKLKNENKCTKCKDNMSKKSKNVLCKECRRRRRVKKKKRTKVYSDDIDRTTLKEQIVSLTGNSNSDSVGKQTEEVFAPTKISSSSDNLPPKSGGSSVSE